MARIILKYIPLTSLLKLRNKKSRTCPFLSKNFTFQENRDRRVTEEIDQSVIIALYNNTK